MSSLGWIWEGLGGGLGEGAGHFSPSAREVSVALPPGVSPHGSGCGDGSIAHRSSRGTIVAVLEVFRCKKADRLAGRLGLQRKNFLAGDVVFCVLFFDGDMWWPRMLHEPCATNLPPCPPGHALLFLHRAMPMSPYQRAKRAFVRVLIGLASSYSVVVGVNRDSDDDTIHMAYRRVVRRVHPDKGGAVADAQQLHAAKDDWDAARKPIRRRGRLPRQEPPHPTVQPIV